MSLRNCTTIGECIEELDQVIWTAQPDTIGEVISEIDAHMEHLRLDERVQYVRAAIGAMRTQARETLLLHRPPHDRSYPDTYGFPGGKAEPGEAMDDTALREFLEETNVLVDIDQELPDKFVPLANRGRIFHAKPYIVVPMSGELRPEEIALSPEHDAYEILKPEAALQRDDDTSDAFNLSGTLTREILGKIS